MKIYEISLKPLSGFGTPLKGDTIFGNICWQVAYDKLLFGQPLDRLLSDYDKNPFIVVSTAFFKIGQDDKALRILKRPDMPISYLFNFEDKNTKDIIADRKILKLKKWLTIGNLEKIENLKTVKYLSEGELTNLLLKEGTRSLKHRENISLSIDFTQPRNTINRLTNTTGEGRFAPFSVEQMVFREDITLIIYIGLRDDILKDQIINAFQRIGETGFGKDASVGLGKFSIISMEEVDLFELGSKNPNACYTLSPCVPNKDVYADIYFTPFTRFGKHGDILSKSKNPFKNPVLMADEGAVVIPKDIKEILKKPYIGKAVSGISKVLDDAIMQGYSLYIPVRVEA